MHAIVALIKKIIQKTVLPLVDCLGKGSGTAFIIELKNLNLRNSLVKELALIKKQPYLSK